MMGEGRAAPEAGRARAQQRQLVVAARGRVALAAALLGLHVAEQHAAPRARSPRARGPRARRPRAGLAARRQRLDPLRLFAPLRDLLEVDPFGLRSGIAC